MTIIDNIKINYIDASDGEGAEFIPMDVLVNLRIVRNGVEIPYVHKIDFEEFEKMTFAELKDFCVATLVVTATGE